MASPAASPETILSALPAELSAGLFKQARAVALTPAPMPSNAGDAGDGCYRVDDGLLKVSFISSSGAERIVAILGPGAIVGELALIDGQPRSAAVTAVRESKLVFVSRMDFDAFCAAHPQVY